MPPNRWLVPPYPPHCIMSARVKRKRGEAKDQLPPPVKEESVVAPAKRPSPPPRQLRVKLTGAGNCTRKMPDDASSEPSVKVVAPAVAAAAAPASQEAAWGATKGAGHFQVGSCAITSGANCVYEVEILQVAEVPAAKAAAKGGARTSRGKATPEAPEVSYLVRYTKWPRRAEEWVPGHFVVGWSEQLAKAATSRAPKKGLWADSATPIDKEAEEEAAAHAIGAEALFDGVRSRRGGAELGCLADAVSSTRNDAPDTTWGDGGCGGSQCYEDGRQRRARRPNERVKDEGRPAGSLEDEVEDEDMEMVESEDAGVALMQGFMMGSQNKDKEDRDEDEDEDGNEDGEEIELDIQVVVVVGWWVGGSTRVIVKAGGALRAHD